VSARGGQDWRRYEEAILAALDFEPSFDPFAAAARRRTRRRGWTVALLGFLHVLFAVLLAEALSAGVGGTPLALAFAAWFGCTVLIARAIFRIGRRLTRLVA